MYDSKQSEDCQANEPVDVPSSKLNRRSFIGRSAAVGVGAMFPLTGAFASGRAERALAGGIQFPGDAAILRFLAAAELLETDLWQQYTELVVGNPDYNAAMLVIDGDMPAYVSENTEDELSHATFLNAFLASEHQTGVNLDAFRTLPSSPATGAQQIGRLTNLMHLNVDTSWYTRYRSSGNPDFGDTFPQIVTITNRPGIPLHDGYTSNEIQAIANTGSFHFAMIEQGGSSLYTTMSRKVNDMTNLEIVTGIGGTEVAHFEIWNDKAGDCPPVDSGDGLVFPDFTQIPQFPANQVMPKPCTFISKNLPLCSTIRPLSFQQVSAAGVVQFLTDTGLFVGQSQAFFNVLNKLAADADRAFRFAI